MQKIKDFLFDTLGIFGIIFYYALGLFVSLYPLWMFNLPFWLYMVLGLLIVLLEKIPLFNQVVWIVGLFGAISGEQDIFAIIYYIGFAIIMGTTIIKLALSFFEKRRKW